MTYFNIAFFLFVLYNKQVKIILASASPRRKQLLAEVVKDFSVCVSNAEEVADMSNPYEGVKVLSQIKADSVFQQNTDALVIGADTIVVFNGDVLGKPKDEGQAREMLTMLSGNTHKVITGVTIMSKERTITFAEESLVTFKKLDVQEIDEYIKTGSPFDKAGAYGIQDSGFVSNIIGSYKNVMGLPVERLAEILQIYGG